jgi:hypothetical protein
LEGTVTPAPPATDAEWRRLLAHFAAIHQITPANAPTGLRPAVLTMTDAGLGRKRIREQIAHLSPAARPQSLTALVRRAEETRFPTWPPAPLVLCRCDPNILNFVRRPGAWRSVDWENSGWGDPAFEIGDLMAHPAYLTVPDARWAWVIDTYATMRADAELPRRIRVYYTLTLVWWVARLARSLYEIPLGRDRRLVDRPADWREDLAAKYNHYMERALAALS